jgi:hypothetical protein
MTDVTALVEAALFGLDRFEILTAADAGGGGELARPGSLHANAATGGSWIPTAGRKR